MSYKDWVVSTLNENEQHQEIDRALLWDPCQLNLIVLNRSPKYRNRLIHMFIGEAYRGAC